MEYPKAATQPWGTGMKEEEERFSVILGEEKGSKNRLNYHFN